MAHPPETGRIGASRRTVMQGIGGMAAIGAGLGTGIGRARAAGTVQMISHRYPALEHYAKKMQAAVPGVEVNTQLMPFDKAMELATITLSSKASSLDITYASDATVLKFAKNGWLRPLDDLWEKYKAEYDFGDYPESVLDAFRYQGKLYVIPGTLNAMLFFYREDVLKEAGKQPPKTIQEYQALAKELNSPRRSGTISCLKPVDAGLNEAHWYMNAIGPGWFDENWKPVFNNEQGVAAIQALKETTGYAQRGFSTAANDECSIALQQDLSAMGLQWASRAGSMDDPAKSKVVGKINWAAAPSGHARLSADGYAISAFTQQDPELLFKIIATALNHDSMMEMASMSPPPRRSVLTYPEFSEKFRHYPAVLASLEVGQPFPAMPEFYEVGEFITRRVLQAVTGEMDVKPALDAAAQETVALLETRGYYK